MIVNWLFYKYGFDRNDLCNHLQKQSFLSYKLV